MPVGHSHLHAAESQPSASAIATRKRATLLLSAILVPLGVVTLIAMVLLWPSGDRSSLSVANPYATAEGVSFDRGTVREVGEGDCPSSQTTVDAGGTAMTCTIAYTQPTLGGDIIPVEVTPELAKTNAVQAGDEIRYLNLANVMQGGAAPYVFVDFVRSVPIMALAVAYAVVVIAVARWRGLRAMIGLVGALVILAQFILPGLVEGKPPLLLGLVGSVVIMYGVLYFAHGFSARTSTALLGTVFGLGVTAALAAWATDAAHLTGVGDENAYTLVNASDELSISSIILCGLIISGLGVLNDVTITQSSSVWELYELAPNTSARRLFASAMRIGRDHIASTVYTIAFAYAGAALPVLILVSLYDRALIDTLTSGELAEEVVRTLVGSIGLVLAIPLTTLLAVLVVKAVGPRAMGGRHDGTSGGVSPAALATAEAHALAPGERLVALGERRARRAAEPDA
ncbi:YibE/F family protein [Arthrobacter sp. NamB2]|uniref:YibE/F family protein n=1 Tax=Arthrobacter sp. NamB2 TaxID=2576035 RepID=UPI0010C98CAC|nr:YibE/F family protein [Arthrobacter sp. NamB2]TKV28027.1 YibE/F family protein [Arthrobacter sp. NamB2]